MTMSTARLLNMTDAMDDLPERYGEDVARYAADVEGKEKEAFERWKASVERVEEGAGGEMEKEVAWERVIEGGEGVQTVGRRGVEGVVRGSG